MSTGCRRSDTLVISKVFSGQGARDAILKLMLHQPDQLDLMFQALADPNRRQMVQRLCEGPASVSELAQPLQMTLSAVVQHLAVLEGAGLVRSQKIGRVRTCQLDTQALRTAERWISERRSLWERRFDRLGAFLAEQDQDLKDGDGQ